MRDFVGELYVRESRRVFSTLVRLLGDFDLAEEAMHEAFAVALEQWQIYGAPANPRAWLVSTARFKAIDALRRRSHSKELREAIVHRVDELSSVNAERAAQDIEDDRLRLVFTCCHPALAPAAQIAMTLREVCGLTTEQIAAAFLTTPTTVAQRIVRAKSKIRDARIPLRGSLARRFSEPPRFRPIRCLFGIQRGILGVGRRFADEGRSVGRGHSPGRIDSSALA